MMTKLELRRIRRKLGWTTTRMASELHVSEESVRGWERGNRIPESMALLIRLVAEGLSGVR